MARLSSFWTGKHMSIVGLTLPTLLGMSLRHVSIFVRSSYEPPRCPANPASRFHRFILIHHTNCVFISFSILFVTFISSRYHTTFLCSCFCPYYRWCRIKDPSPDEILFNAPSPKFSVWLLLPLESMVEVLASWLGFGS